MLCITHAQELCMLEALVGLIVIVGISHIVISLVARWVGK
jgi:hypothetical protein